MLAEVLGCESQMVLEKLTGRERIYCVLSWSEDYILYLER